MQRTCVECGTKCSEPLCWTCQDLDDQRLLEQHRRYVEGMFLLPPWSPTPLPCAPALRRAS